MLADKDKNIYLFSLDVECDRNTSDGDEFTGRVPGNIDRYLEFLNKHNAHCTFFVMGNIARKYPEMLRKIEDQGHEVGCHSNLHTPLTEMDEASFKEDLQNNIASVKDAGIQSVRGFRAPFFSLTDKTPWAYKVMQEEGITYSSSVIPVKNPTYCWEGFNPRPSKFMHGVWELPMSTSGLPVLKDAFPEFSDKAFFRYLMFRNRDTVFDKLARLIQDDFQIMSYSRYIEKELEGK
jgi:peptidoglycan/xylan/chitin deacetylase (PgdA/CDA1 family)